MGNRKAGRHAGTSIFGERRQRTGWGNLPAVEHIPLAYWEGNKNNDIAALKNVMKNFTAEIIEETTTETANEFLGQHDGFRGCIRSF